MAEAQKASGQPSKNRTVEEALRLLIRLGGNGGQRRLWEISFARQPRPQPQGARGLLIGTWCIARMRVDEPRRQVTERKANRHDAAERANAPRPVMPSSATKRLTHRSRIVYSGN